MLQRLLFSTAALFTCLLAQAPGGYSGSWTSNATGGAGKLTLSFTNEALSSATFSFQDQDVITKPISFKKDIDQVEFVFEYTLDGNVLRSRMQGTTSPAAIKGKYKSTTADGVTPVDEGTWEVTLKP